MRINIIRQKLLATFLQQQEWDIQNLNFSLQTIGFNKNLLTTLFEDKLQGITSYFFQTINEKMYNDFNESNLLSINAKIKLLLNIRVSLLYKYIKILPKILNFIDLPWNFALNCQINWQTSDFIWRTIKDTSHDYNYYTKRLSLSLLIKNSDFYLKSDNGSNFLATLNFIDKQLILMRYFQNIKKIIKF